MMKAMSNRMSFLKRFLVAKPAFIRLINSAFAALVAFEQVEVTEVQFAVVVLVIENLFQYVSNVAYVKDVEELATLKDQATVVRQPMLTEPMFPGAQGGFPSP